MPTPIKEKSNKPGVQQKNILHYFGSGALGSSPATKRQKVTEAPSPATVKTSPLKQKNEEISSPNKSSLSEEQIKMIEEKKKAAEAKRLESLLCLEGKTMGSSWHDALSREFSKAYFVDLKKFLEKEKLQNQVIYPPENDIYSWTRFCKLENVKVVIVGQDPYHGPNQAHGLCFSVRKGVKAPPSLVNMYKELGATCKGFEVPNHGCLVSWAEQGVLLLNAALTVRAANANSHAGKGWEKFTDTVINILSNRYSGIVFMLWGSYAQKKGANINRRKHKVLECPHPSPLSAHRGFFGSKHFVKANDYLALCNKDIIDWTSVCRDNRTNADYANIYKEPTAYEARIAREENKTSEQDPSATGNCSKRSGCASNVNEQKNAVPSNVS
eukprot:Nk52_evm113s224 gene=Nk52_evmTU113s224